jgi:hypothetical protein
MTTSQLEALRATASRALRSACGEIASPRHGHGAQVLMDIAYTRAAAAELALRLKLARRML